MAKAQNKTVENDGSVAEFINSVADETKKTDCQKIDAMMQEISGHQPKMWGKSIVGYGNYHYKYDSGREGDFMKIGFSPRAQNLTLYIMPGFERYDEIMSRLGKHKTGKSCLYVKKLADVDEDVLKELLTESYGYMTEKYG